MIAALLMIAPLAPAQAEPQPIVTTIAALSTNPKKFDGRLVRLHGWVSSCQPMNCVIAERPANAPGGAGRSLSIGGNAKFDATVTPLLPTYVEFDARFSADCVISICTDRAPVLTIVRLRGIVSPEPPEIEK